MTLTVSQTVNIDYKALPLKDLHVEASWQKERFDQRFSNKIAAQFNPALLGVLSVALDSHGIYQIWDGQHRLDALRKLGYTDWMCAIVRADTVQQAEMFVAQAQRKGITGSNMHAAKVYVDPISRDIDGIVKNHGFVLTPGHDNTIRAVSTIYRIRLRAGSKILDRTLNIVKQAWPGKKSGRGDTILDGVATFLQAYDGIAVDQEVVKALAAYNDPAVFLAGAYKKHPTVKIGSTWMQTKKFQAVALFIAREYGRANKTTKLHNKRIMGLDRSIKP